MSRPAISRDGNASVSSRFARAPWGLLGMLPLILGVEGYLQATRLDRTEPISYEWRLACERAAAAEALESEILCFGDSLIRSGVQPHVLEERLGVRAYNLAIGGAPPAASYFLLKRVLDRGCRPRAILVDFEPIFHTFSPWTRASVWPELLEGPETCALAGWMGQPDFAAAMVLAEVFPSIRDRYVIKSRFLSWTQGRHHAPDQRQNRLAQGVERRQIVANRGSVLLAMPKEGPRASANEFVLTNAIQEATEPSVAKAQRAFLDLAHKHAIPVHVLIPPRRADALEHCRKVGAHARQDRDLTRWLEEYPGLRVIDARLARYDADVFTDGTHLSRSGSIAFTAAVADALSRQMRPGLEFTERIAHVPDYQPVETTRPMEDNRRSLEWARAERRLRR
jgi:lysophospholipase L1-like esterase